MITQPRLLTIVFLCNVGGVFHIVFFKDMEKIWTSQPSMLLARQSLILHLQYNTTFTVVTSIDNFWEEQWKKYLDDKIPAFLLLTDAENIPWKAEEKEREAVEFFFRSFLCHSLGQGLNCVFISGIEMTATKVMGFYTESLSVHKFLFRKVCTTNALHYVSKAAIEKFPFPILFALFPFRSASNHCTPHLISVSEYLYWVFGTLYSV